MIINQMYHFISTEKKIRFNFYEFMQTFQEQSKIYKDQLDSIKSIILSFKKKYQIIFLDEFHISDIATAMLLKNILENLFSNNIYLVISSNYPPDNLYANGLLRERFIPTIELIENKLEALCLSGIYDYRLVNKPDEPLFFIENSHAQNQLNQVFDKIRQDESYMENGKLLILGRPIKYIKKSRAIIWFEFEFICGDKRSQLDYLEIIQQYKWFIITKIPFLTPNDKDKARRFTWLIDILYDNKCNLALSSYVAIEQIYLNGDFANEFTRTSSRLKEMQTYKYAVS